MAVQIIVPAEADRIIDPVGGVAADDVISRRAALHALHDRVDTEGKIDLARETREPSPAREPIDSLVIATPVGEIEFGPPPGVSLTMRIATMMGEENPNRIQSAMLRTLMCVRKIDGKTVTPVTTMVEAQYLANQLTDPVLDFLFTTYLETWPPPAPGELQVISKNKRVR